MTRNPKEEQMPEETLKARGPIHRRERPNSLRPTLKRRWLDVEAGHRSRTMKLQSFRRHGRSRWLRRLGTRKGQTPPCPGICKRAGQSATVPFRHTFGTGDFRKIPMLQRHRR